MHLQLSPPLRFTVQEPSDPHKSSHSSCHCSCMGDGSEPVS